MNWDYFTFAIMGVIILMVVSLLFFFGDLPGKIARGRNHPQADAINVCSWIGLAAGGVGWVVALVWAYTKPVSITVTPNLAGDETTGLGPEAIRAEIARLEAVLARLEQKRTTPEPVTVTQGDPA